MKSFEMALQLCPNCSSKLEVCIPTNNELVKEEREGDISICGHCSQVLIFGKDLKLTKIGLGDLDKDLRDMVQRALDTLIVAQAVLKITSK